MSNKLTWQEAAAIHIAVLQNPDASFEAVKNAKEDLMWLAKTVDDVIKLNKELQ